MCPGTHTFSVFLKQCAFVQEQNVLANNSKCHIKVKAFFYQIQ